MNKKYLIAIIVAAVVVVGLIVIIPSLLTGGGNNVAAVPAGANGQTAPPISPGETLPPNHPTVDTSSQTANATAQAAAVEAAVTSAEAAYKQNPKDVKTLLALGQAYLEANRPDDANKIFGEVLVIEPKNSDARAGMALVTLTKGDAAKAQTQLEEVIKDDPNSQNAHYQLAIVLWSANQADKAKLEWEKVVALGADTAVGQMSQQFLTLISTSSGSGQSPHGGATTTTSAP
jgi:cytochrome c-type biogenesis protein CcmH/NrfG